MPRKYIRTVRQKPLAKYTPEQIDAALGDIDAGLTYRKCSDKHNIPVTVLHRHNKFRKANIEVLCIINVLSNSLQNKSSTLGFSKNVIFGVIKTFESLRSEDEFKKIWEKIKILAEENGICIQTPLTVVNESEEDEETEIKSIIIEIIDKIENENDCTEKETTQTRNKKLYRWRKGDKTKWKKSIVAEKKKLSKTPRIIDCSNYYNRQKDYYLSSVSQAVVKRHVPTTKVRKPKEVSKVYSLNLNSTSEQVRVCKQFYLKTLAISHGPVDKAFEGFDSVSGFFSNTDKRGKHSAANKTSTEKSDKPHEQQILMEYENHIRRRDESFAAKNFDKEKASNCNNFCSATFDLQSVLQIPSSDVSSTNTTNMKKHLILRHPSKIEKIQENHEQEYMNEDINPDSPTVTTNSEDIHVQPSNMMHFKQQTITKTVQVFNSYKEGGQSEIKITNTILYMIAKDNLPLNTIEKPGFIKLLKITAPLYKLPKRKYITKCMDDKYEIISDMFKNELKKIEHCSITTDIWTDKHTTKSFLGVTVHFIDAGAEDLKSAILAIKLLDDAHTAANLGVHLEEVIQRWGITKDKIVAVISDGASNIVKCINDTFGHDKALVCYAHKLNLLVGSALSSSEEFTKIVEKVKSIVTFFRHSVKASDILRHLQLNGGRSEGTCLKLKQECPTRWNSLFYMLMRFLELIEVVSTALLRVSGAPSIPSQYEIKVLKEGVKMLCPFELATKEFSTGKHVSASKVIPLIAILDKKLNNLMCTTKEAQHLLNQLKIEFYKRFQNVEKISLLAVSTILDPRFKRIHFRGPLNAANAVQFIHEEMKRTNTLHENSNNTEIEQSSDTRPQPQVLEDSLWDDHDLHVSQQSLTNINDSYLPSIKLYLQSNIEDRTISPVTFWENSHYKCISNLGLKYACVLASSVPSERLFSSAGNILTDCRSRLLSKRFEKLTFLSSVDEKYWNI
ncbi:hypothetical protein ACI65C_013263 [Semiaphis heraclei]